MVNEWMLSWGCHWNSSLGMWECHGLNNEGRIDCPHSWMPRTGMPNPEKPTHDPKCPIGKMVVMLARVRKMKVVVDASLAPDEIRVSDPMVAQWLEGDGRLFRSRVYKEAGYCTGHEAHESEQR